MEYPDCLWHLLARKYSGEASEKDLSELDHLLEQYPELNPAVNILEQFWKTPATPDNTTRQEDEEQQLNQLRKLLDD